MLKLERIPGKLRRELHGTFQNGRQLPKLRETGDPVGLRLAAALETTLSEELDEIMNLSDRILTMCGCKITGERKESETNEQELGLLMAGVVYEAA